MALICKDLFSAVQLQLVKYLLDSYFEGSKKYVVIYSGNLIYFIMHTTGVYEVCHSLALQSAGTPAMRVFITCRLTNALLVQIMPLRTEIHKKESYR